MEGGGDVYRGISGGERDLGQAEAERDGLIATKDHGDICAQYDAEMLRLMSGFMVSVDVSVFWYHQRPRG